MIPVIDCSPIANKAFEDVSEEDFNKVANDIGAAMTGIGMCNLINHGIDKEKIEKIYKVSKEFFELPRETKRKHRKVSPTKSFHGYGGPDDELLNEEDKNSSELREFWDVWGFEAHDEKYYPQEVPGFKTVFDEVRGELENAGKKILRCLEKYLNLEDGFLISRHTNLGNPTVRTQTQFRSLYYYTLDPHGNFPPNAIRCGEHSDWGTIDGIHTKTPHGALKLNEEDKNSSELREFWDVWGFEAHDEKYYPQEVPGFKTVFDEVRGELENAGKKILRCLEKYLNLEDGFLISRHTNLGNPTVRTQTQFRSLYYYTLDPHGNFPPNAIRCGEHSDWGTITFLIQDMVGGLEVKTSEGEWIEAAPVENAILLNSGQLLEYWTGGHFHAAPHRVRILTEGRIAHEPRQSFIHFINPDGDAEVFPVIPVLPKKQEQFAKYNNETLIAYEHYQKRIANATY